MKDRVKGTKLTVIVIAILAVLIGLGRDSVITWSLVGAVGAYLGLDLAVMHKWKR